MRTSIQNYVSEKGLNKKNIKKIKNIKKTTKKLKKKLWFLIIL